MGGVMSSITISGDTSGSVILQAPAVAGSTTLTLPATSGTVLTSANTFANSGGPAFSAYYNGTSTAISSSTWTKVPINTKDFDTNSNYDTSTYRFTPTVAGYYQINGTVVAQNGSNSGQCYLAIYKNGSLYKSNYFYMISGNGFFINQNQIVSMNGSTDYLELYFYTNTTSVSIYGTTYASLAPGAGAVGCYFSGAMVRGA